MAEKRMFSMKICDSDAFLDMSLEAQALYFHLNLRADDDGMIGNSKRIIRLIGASREAFEELLTKRFILQFDGSDVIVIKHWRMHNTLKADRYKETNYIDEKSKLLLKENNAYSFTSGNKMETKCFQNDSKMETKWKQNGNISETQNSIDKNRKDKNRYNKRFTADEMEVKEQDFEDIRSKIFK